MSTPPEIHDNGSPERRRHERVDVATVVHFASERSGKATGVLRELSISGARVLTNAHLKADDQLDLTLSLPAAGDAPATTMDLVAHVVRSEALDRQRSGVWTHIVAIRFENELTGHDEQLVELATKLASQAR